MDSSIGTNGNRFTPSDSQKAQSVVPSREAGTSPTTTSGRVAAQVPSPTANDSQTANGSLAENSSSEWTGEPDQGDLINIGEAGDISTAPSRPQSESTDLLSSLEPVDPSNGAVSNAPPFEVTREEILITVRSLFTYFICSSGDFRAEALDQTAEGVRSGVLKHLLQEARAQGLSAEKIQDLEELTNSLLASVIRDHRSKTRRFRYTVEELQSMRHAALEPPGGLADIPDLPKPQKNNGQAKASAPNTPHFNQSQVSKSADAMQWVLGEASASQPIPEKESKTGAQTGESTVSGMANGAATRDLGLKSSRWATGTEEIKHANFFTGPAYEKAWSKRSHLEDLAQLDPQTRVTVGAEDLLDFYFPMSTEDNIPASSSQSRVVSNGDSQMSGPMSATAPRNDNIETLRVGMSRLTIGAPTAAQPRLTEPSGPALSPSPATSQHPEGSRVQPSPTTPTQASAGPATQPKVRGLAASRHCSGDAPSSSGNFNFYLPGAGQSGC
jgi:hypothetical protein